MARKSTSNTTAAAAAAAADPSSPTTQSPPSHPSSSSPQPDTTAAGTAAATPKTSGGTVEATEQQLKARAEAGVGIEDYLLPRSLTIRLAKSVLPPNTSIQKDAVLALQKAATVFVSYLSSHANEATLKRTVAPADVFHALTELEFDSFRGRLEKELDAFTELKAGKRRGKKDDDDDDEDEDDDDDEEDGEEEPKEEDDIDRVEDLDGGDARHRARVMNPDVDGDETDSEHESGPGNQLRGEMG
ncbi:histone-fold-containing protein [Aspergillus japonicus CBS 114.51]|uniref:DNA polymerase epsilon subunit D n=1 Tax=Aspergillus japonicus CBS 114.51 TaxID=1448312 RepID=A0A8T8WKU3_ASPJA|nr:histone-fold-containing protein [Aspergillus japonicus CBS 114.51]RAH76069.1 histone-fold-containing protein [Aspergillus japonicus CBS 114.51]